MFTSFSFEARIKRTFCQLHNLQYMSTQTYTALYSLSMKLQHIVVNVSLCNGGRPTQILHRFYKGLYSETGPVYVVYVVYITTQSIYLNCIRSV